MPGAPHLDEHDPDGYVHFWTTGSAVKGEFHCSECSYGVTVYRELPVCPMCGGTSWEQTAWSPLTRSLRESGARFDD
jgi:hypothetical protein